MGRKRTCELPFCNGVVEGTRNKRRCDNDRNIHLHQVISKNVKKIMKFVEGCVDLTANDVNRELFKGKLDKNEKGSMYRLFQAMVREGYLFEKGKREGLKVYSCSVRSQKKQVVRREEAPVMISSGDAAPVSPPGDGFVVEMTLPKAETANRRHDAVAPATNPLIPGGDQVSAVEAGAISPLPGVLKASESKPIAASPEPTPVAPREILIGKLREFVHLKNGSWNHDDWLWLIHRCDVIELKIHPLEIGQLLEREKTAYWSNRV